MVHSAQGAQTSEELRPIIQSQARSARFMTSLVRYGMGVPGGLGRGRWARAGGLAGLCKIGSLRISFRPTFIVTNRFSVRYYRYEVGSMKYESVTMLPRDIGAQLSSVRHSVRLHLLFAQPSGRFAGSRGAGWRVCSCRARFDGRTGLRRDNRKNAPRRMCMSRVVMVRAAQILFFLLSLAFELIEKPTVLYPVLYRRRAHTTLRQ